MVNFFAHYSRQCELLLSGAVEGYFFAVATLIFFKDPAFQEKLVFADQRAEINWIVTHDLLEIGHGWRHQLQQHHNRGASQTISLGVFAAHRDGFTFTADAMEAVTLDTV